MQLAAIDNDLRTEMDSIEHGALSQCNLDYAIGKLSMRREHIIVSNN